MEYHFTRNEVSPQVLWCPYPFIYPLYRHFRDSGGLLECQHNLVILYWAWGNMIQRRSNIGSVFRKDWLIWLIPYPCLLNIFSRLTMIANLSHNVILFHKRVKRNQWCMTHFGILILSCYTSSILTSVFKLGFHCLTGRIIENL